jgi:hypothetical protein
MWWQDLLWGAWNGCTGWIVLIAHILGFWDQFPLYNEGRSSNWYDLGFVVGASALFSGRSGASAVRARRKRSRDEVNV